MCHFFSFVTDIKGNKYYFNQEQRNTICKENKYEPDSHTSIADFYGFNGNKEDLLNKYEYNPYLEVLHEDTITFSEDFNQIWNWCKSLDFKTIDLLQSQKIESNKQFVSQYKGKFFKVNQECIKPSGGWGKINYISIGKCVGIDKDGWLLFNFPEQEEWCGKIEEMIKVE